MNSATNVLIMDGQSDSELIELCTRPDLQIIRFARTAHGWVVEVVPIQQPEQPTAARLPYKD